MSKEKLPTARCKHAGHTQHICALADQYFHINCPDEFKAMVTDAKLKCQFCGRTARSNKNLCYPAEL
jgi:hypothetical protein